MNATLSQLWLIPLAYLIGSISFAVVVSKMMGLPDPYTHGSKNPGATNVLRTGNKLAAALTLIGDAAKGWLAVTIARAVLGDPAQESTNILLGLVALAVFIGHLYPVFHRFKGGQLGSGFCDSGNLVDCGDLYALLLAFCFMRRSLCAHLFHFFVWHSTDGLSHSDHESITDLSPSQ
jgi:acyl-phosphate glycerol 3-phosphate acyltransferase